MAAPTTFASPAAEEAYIRAQAQARNLDPDAVMAVAQHEGITLPSQVGDSGTSFGPWQLHHGGSLPESIWAQGPAYAQQWADSQQGINFALDEIASVASYEKGFTAIHDIVYLFERPKNPAREYADAAFTYASKHPIKYGGVFGSGAAGAGGTGAVTAKAGQAVAGGISSVGDLISFLTSWRFIEIVGGFFLLIVGLILLGRQFGMSVPSPPVADKAASGADSVFAFEPGERSYRASQASRRTSREGTARRTRSYTLEADKPAPRRTPSAEASADEIPF